MHSRELQDAVVKPKKEERAKKNEPGPRGIEGGGTVRWICKCINKPNKQKRKRLDEVGGVNSKRIK